MIYDMLLVAGVDTLNKCQRTELDVKQAIRSRMLVVCLTFKDEFQHWGNTERLSDCRLFNSLFLSL